MTTQPTTQDSYEFSAVPCCKCKGPVVEFTVPNEVWNAIIRRNGPETDQEYLCKDCYIAACTEYFAAQDQHLKEARAALATQTERADKLQAEAEERKRDCYEVRRERDQAIQLRNEHTAELDAVRKAVEYWKEKWNNQTANYDTAQARCAELERVIQEAPHSDKCHFAYHPNGWICTCWKSRISPDQKPALKGGDAGMFTKAPPMTGAADVQSESRPSPDHGKAGEWLPIEISKPAPCIVVLGFSADWIDFDYNPAGIRECFMDDMEIWLSPKWNNYQDVYENDVEAPTHWQPLPAPPTPDAKQSEEGV